MFVFSAVPHIFVFLKTRRIRKAVTTFLTVQCGFSLSEKRGEVPATLFESTVLHLFVASFLSLSSCFTEGMGLAVPEGRGQSHRHSSPRFSALVPFFPVKNKVPSV